MKNIFCKTPKNGEKTGIIFTGLHISWTSGLIQDGWPSLPASAYSLVRCHASHSLWRSPLCTHGRASMEEAHHIV